MMDYDRFKAELMKYGDFKVMKRGKTITIDGEINSEHIEVKIFDGKFFRILYKFNYLSDDFSGFEKILNIIGGLRNENSDIQ